MLRYYIVFFYLELVIKMTNFIRADGFWHFHSGQGLFYSIDPSMLGGEIEINLWKNKGAHKKGPESCCSIKAEMGKTIRAELEMSYFDQSFRTGLYLFDILDQRVAKSG